VEGIGHGVIEEVREIKKPSFRIVVYPSKTACFFLPIETVSSDQSE
jgi:hypothetical protein